MIKMFKMSELPKCDTETQSEQILLLKEKKNLAFETQSCHKP